MPCADGFLLPLPKKNLEAYRRLARKAGRVWREHGALDERLQKMMGSDDMPFDVRRMAYGGFRVLVDV